MDSGKSWRRRLRSPIRRLFLAFVVTAQWASAQPSDGDSAARGFATLQAFLDSVQSLTADFEQEIWMGDTRVQTDKGSLSLKRPNRFRWNYVDPTELVVAADGKQLWIHDVELEQVTVAPFDGSLGASRLRCCRRWRRARAIRGRANVYGRGARGVKLAPRGGGSDFTSVLIGFSGTAPRRLELVDGLNEVTRIQLDNLSTLRAAIEVVELDTRDLVEAVDELEPTRRGAAEADQHRREIRAAATRRELDPLEPLGRIRLHDLELLAHVAVAGEQHRRTRADGSSNGATVTCASSTS